MKKRIKRFFVVMAVLLAIPILAIGVMTIWNSIETKKRLGSNCKCKVWRVFYNQQW